PACTADVDQCIGTANGIAGQRSDSPSSHVDRHAADSLLEPANGPPGSTPPDLMPAPALPAPWCSAVRVCAPCPSRHVPGPCAASHDAAEGCSTWHYDPPSARQAARDPSRTRVPDGFARDRYCWQSPARCARWPCRPLLPHL